MQRFSKLIRKKHELHVHTLEDDRKLAHSLVSLRDDCTTWYVYEGQNYAPRHFRNPFYNALVARARLYVYVYSR